MTDSSAVPPDEPDCVPPDEAFSVLANRNRLDIIYALWEAHDPPGTTSVPFSKLFERVDVEDTGNFSYHLDKLVDIFVTRTEDGYALRNTGRKIIANVLAGRAVEEPDAGPEPVDRHCVRCGAQVEGYYEDERLYLLCPDCEGAALSGAPDGSVVAFNFPPSGLRDRTMTEAFSACEVASGYYAWTMNEGVCPECTCAMDVSVDVCEDHRPEADEPCPTCGSFGLGRVYYVCPTCKADWQAPTALHVAAHPAVIAFYYDHGADAPAPLTDWETIARRAYREYDEELLSTDPLRIEVTIPVEGDELHVTLDENVDVVDVTEPTRVSH